MAFSLFLLLNAIFFIRPDDFVTGLAELRLYLSAFVVCLLFSWRELSVTIRQGKLSSDPITCCILLYGIVFTISNIFQVSTSVAIEKGFDYVKLFLYYLLFISLVTTPERLRKFVVALVLCILVISAMVLLDYFEVFEIEVIEPFMQKLYDEDGSILGTVPRLKYLGTFQDPNDFSMLLGVGIIFSVYLFNSGASILRGLWLIPLASCVFLMTLTQSRGGLLGLAAGVAAYFASRLGWRKALPLAIIAVAALLFIIGGRQADFSLSDGTGQDRLRIWSEGLTLMTEPKNILIGIGVEKYQDEVGQVAHNSYLHAFVETGMIGGIIFSGMFLLILGALFLQKPAWLYEVSPILGQFLPYLLAALASYLMCMFSLSRNYVVTTFMMLGLCSAFLQMANTQGSPTQFRMGLRMVFLVCCLGFIVFVALKLFLMLFVQFGS